MVNIGCKGKYQKWIEPDGLKLIESYAREGLTDAQICEKIGIAKQTLYDWEKKFPELSDSIKKGKAPVDIDVENALLKNALGYEYEETVTEIINDADGGQRRHVRKMVKHMSPDTTAQIYWLKNRRPDRWRDRPNAAGNDIDDPLLAVLKRWDDAAGITGKS